MSLNFEDEDNPYRNALESVDRMDGHLAEWQRLEAQGDGLGLGLEGPAQSPMVSAGPRSAEEPTVPGWVHALKGIGGAVEAFGAGFQGRTPLFLQQQQLDQQQQQLKQVAADRRQMMALRIQQAEEQKRQHNWGIAEKLITSGNMGALEEFGKSFPDVLPIVQGVSKQHLSSLPVLAKGGYLPEDVVQRVMSPKPDDQPMTPAELSMHVKLGMENWQADIKEQAKNKLLTDSLNTPAEQRKPHQQLLVDEHQQKLDLQAAQTDLARANAQKARKEAEGGTDKVTQTMNGLSRGFYGLDARDLTPDMMVTPEDIGRIKAHGLAPPVLPISRLTALSRYANVDVPTLMAGNRAIAGQTAQLTVPDKPSPTERQSLVDDIGTLSRLDSLKSLYDSTFVGPMRGRIGEVTEMFGGIAEDEADFRAEVATLKNQVIKQITGAQMSEPEARRIMKQIPDANNPPTVFESRLKRTRENVLMMAKKRRKILSSSGIDVSRLEPLPEQYEPSPFIKNALDEVLGQ